MNDKGIRIVVRRSPRKKAIGICSVIKHNFKKILWSQN